jgi:hypothetical protein
MAIKTPIIDVPARQAAGPAGQNRPIARDRRAVRTKDLSAEQIAAVAASEMEGGFEHRSGISVVELGVCRKLRGCGNTAE